MATRLTRIGTRNGFTGSDLTAKTADALKRIEVKCRDGTSRSDKTVCNARITIRPRSYMAAARITRDSSVKDASSDTVRAIQTSVRPSGSRRRLLATTAEGGISPEVTVISEGEEPLQVDQAKAETTLAILGIIGIVCGVILLSALYYACSSGETEDSKLRGSQPYTTNTPTAGEKMQRGNKRKEEPYSGEGGIELANRHSIAQNMDYSGEVMPDEFPDFDTEKNEMYSE